MMDIQSTRIVIPGIKREYHFIEISDLHFSVSSDACNGAKLPVPTKYITKFSKNDLLPSAAWHVFENYMKAEKDSIDGILIAGDCIDVCNRETLEAVKSMFKEISAEIFYTPGNHELLFLPGGDTDLATYSEIMRGCADFWVHDYGDFRLVGINDANGYVTENQLDAFEKQVSLNSPIILLMHIPIKTEETLDAIRKRWGSRDMYFILDGENTSECTERFCELIRDEKSNVVAIFAGHIHASCEGAFSKKGKQYTSAPLFEQYIRKIKISPQ